ncbi:MAG: hypothetical protein AAGA54_22470 [Myxococcota bacterium]
MFLVSGTKRSGTSMWMQVLRSAGVPVLGSAFPRNWGESSLKDANPDGFYESILRQGIYFRTNPHPGTGAYFMPDDVAGYAVKVFIPGVVRTERAYIDLVVANVREWREYEASINRLYALEQSDREKKNPDADQPLHFPPAYEWWMENFALMRDISLRGYDYQLQTYDEVVAEPQRVIPEVLGRMKLPDANIEAAVAAVKPDNRTQDRDADQLASDSVPDELAETFDELYMVVKERRPVAGAFLKRLNDTNRALLPKLTALQSDVVQAMAKEQQRTGAKPKPMGIEGLPKTAPNPKG